MTSDPPLVLDLGPDPGPYAAWLTLLLVLFFLRVIGQVLAATAAPSWLPPMRRWYSGLMPYRYLLPTQIVFLVVMTTMTVSVAREAFPLGAAHPVVGRWLIWGSYVYFLGMVVRGVRYAFAPPERRGVLIPIIFHVVLAGFLFVYASWIARAAGP